MKVLVVGCGRIGSVAAEDFAKNMPSVEVFLADKNATRTEELAKKIGTDNISPTELDVSDCSELTDTLEEFNLVMGFLPGRLGSLLVKACVDAKKDLMDVSYMPENPLTLNEEAAKAGVAIIPDCGLAPGISNVLVGHAIARVDKVHAVHIMVGGLPENPVPPLDYVITWSPENLIDEYTRKARIVRDGVLVDVEALTGLEEVEFPDVGKLEAFYTDGLRTLPHTIRDVKEMWEKTLRYPGHAEKIRLFKALGFFDEEQIDVNGLSLSPRRFTAKLFERKLQRPDVKDIVIMKIEIAGITNERRVHYVYRLSDQYDHKKRITAMARTTAYPASIVAQLMLRKVVQKKGVIPLEVLGRSEEFSSTFLKELEKRGIRIAEEEVTD